MNAWIGSIRGGFHRGLSPARFRYARWDGGNLDVVKGFLSGWPHWREPDQVLAVANWYEPRNVELVKMAHLNWIWVTFSNGFSLESERPQQERLAEFIAACHREGIHTTAYMSIANMFPDDMFRREPQSRQWLAQGKDGKPVPYGAGQLRGLHQGHALPGLPACTRNGASI